MNKNDLKKWLINTGREIRTTRQAFKNAQREGNRFQTEGLRWQLSNLRSAYTDRHRLYSLANGKTPKQIEKAGFDLNAPYVYLKHYTDILEEYGLELDLKAVENV